MKLSEYLEAHRLSFSEFAKRIDRSVSTVSRLARGEHRPDWPTIDLIAEATNGAVQPNDWRSAA